MTSELELLRAENAQLREALSGLRRLLEDQRRLRKPRDPLRSSTRGTCVVCGRDVAVRDDGTVRLHSSGSGDLRARVRTCNGSLLPPGEP